MNEVIAQIAASTKRDFHNLVAPLLAWFAVYAEKAVTAFFRWALSKYAIQQVIADTFSGSTPMCRVLRDAINSAQITVDADDVHGLDRAIDEEVDRALSSDHREFTQAVNSAVEEYLQEQFDELKKQLVDPEELTDSVARELADRLLGR